MTEERAPLEVMEAKAREIAKLIDSQMPPGWGADA